MRTPTPEVERLPCIQLSHPSGGSAEVSLYGGQVTSWVDGTNRELLYLSRLARAGGAVSIRGGIPVVFPQFANEGPLPKHGLLRTRTWKATHVERSSATLEIGDDAETRALWPHPFAVRLAVTLTDTLTLCLTVLNTGASAFSFTGALHTYFAVNDIRSARIAGLQGRRYRDKVRGAVEIVDDAPEVVITEQTDRIYVGGSPNVVIRDPAGSRSMRLWTRGFGDWVVWNPWVELNATFADMEPDDYRRMVCVEAARIAHPVTLEPGASWLGVQVLTPI